MAVVTGKLRLCRRPLLPIEVCLLLSDSFFFNDTATTEIYTLSLHDALPISAEFVNSCSRNCNAGAGTRPDQRRPRPGRDRKSTRLNSSHANISYAAFCLKKDKFPRCSLTR